MMVANVPAVLLGDRLADQPSIRFVDIIAVPTFAIPGTEIVPGADRLPSL